MSRDVTKKVESEERRPPNIFAAQAEGFPGSHNKVPGGDPAEVRPSDSRAESQAELNGPSGSPTSPPGRVSSEQEVEGGERLTFEEYSALIEDAEQKEALFDAQEYLIAGLENKAEWWEHLGDAHRDYAALARASVALVSALAAARKDADTQAAFFESAARELEEVEDALREARPYVFGRIDPAKEDWRTQTARDVLRRVDAALASPAPDTEARPEPDAFYTTHENPIPLLRASTRKDES